MCVDYSNEFYYMFLIYVCFQNEIQNFCVYFKLQYKLQEQTFALQCIHSTC